jgi:hypothetical protein
MQKSILACKGLHKVEMEDEAMVRNVMYGIVSSFYQHGIILLQENKTGIIFIVCRQQV